MAERDEFLTKSVSYNSPFTIAEVYNVLDQYYAEKGYDKYEKYTHEYHRKASKEVHAEIHFYREITDYFLLRIKIAIDSKDLKYIEVERHGKKTRMLQGPISFRFVTHFVTDRESNLSKKGVSPFWLYIKVLFDTFVYNREVEKYKKEIVNDINEGIKRLNKYFNYPQS